MKYRNYTIEKADSLNWTWTKTETKTAAHDQRNPKTGEVIRKAGETYQQETEPRFYGDVGNALAGIVKDLAGEGCEDIAALSLQLGEIKAELRQLTKLSK